MSKMIELKEWLSLPDAAKYLTRKLEEDVAEADVLRLALDGRLVLSVYFVNFTKAKCGKKVRYENAEWGEFSAEMTESFPSLPEEAKGKPLPYIRSLSIDGEYFINLSDNISTLKGVWDLPMIGNERLDVEHRYQQLTGGPEVTLGGLDGAFVSREDDEICQLQEDFEDNQYQPGSVAAGDALEQRIFTQGVGTEEANSLRMKYREQRKEYLSYRSSQPIERNYYPARGLPEDGVLVVRTASLVEFEKSLMGRHDDQIGVRERDTLYKIIIGMASIAYKYDPAAQRSDVIPEIVRDLEDAGVAVHRDTVRKHIKAAADLLPKASQRA